MRDVTEILTSVCVLLYGQAGGCEPCQESS